MSDYPRTARPVPENSTSAPLDRGAALLDLAIHVGIGLIWFVGLLQSVSQPNFGPWISDHWRDIAYYIGGIVFGCWTDLGIYRSRRWAFVIRITIGALSLSALIWARRWPETLIEVVAIGFCIARMTSLIGPRLRTVRPTQAFLLDKLFASLALLLNLFFMGYWMLRSATTGQWGSAWALSQYAVQMFRCFWFTWGLFQSRGWAIVGGAMLGLLLTIWQLPTVPWWGTSINVVGLLYIGLRLIALGPRPEVLLGLDSQ